MEEIKLVGKKYKAKTIQELSNILLPLFDKLYTNQKSDFEIYDTSNYIVLKCKSCSKY